MKQKTLQKSSTFGHFENIKPAFNLKLIKFYSYGKIIGYKNKPTN
jgi:hypothetical protein